MGLFQKRINAEREVLATMTDDWRKEHKELFSTTITNMAMFSNWVEEAKKAHPLSMDEERWQQFIKGSDKEWLIKILLANREWFVRWFIDE